MYTAQMSLKARLTELYSRLVGRSFTATYEGERTIKGTKLTRQMVSIEDTEGIVEDLGDIVHALEDAKVCRCVISMWKFSPPHSHFLSLPVVQVSQIFLTSSASIVHPIPAFLFSLWIT